MKEEQKTFCYCVTKDTTDGFKLRYNEETGEWEKYELYVTIDCMTEEDFEHIKTAVEKQKAKKVTHEATLYKCCTCPNCKNVVDEFKKWGESTVRIQYQYCYFCGQKLDWEEEQ